MTSAAPYIGIFGGCFNPPHLGHMRLAVEILETMRPCRLDFLPCAVPPHKSGRSVLPFALRARMLEEAIAGEEGFRVNRMENERSGPSYTVDTLRVYRAREPGARFFFIVGAEDFSHIHTWREWRHLPALADIVVVPRSGSGMELFTDTARRCWPEAIEDLSCPGPADSAYIFPDSPGSGRLLHVPLPRLDMRAEYIRERFRSGRSIRFLVPACVDRLLRENPEAARCWDE